MAGQSLEPGKLTFVIPAARVDAFPVGVVVDDLDIRGDPIQGTVDEAPRVANAAAILIIRVEG